MGKIYAVKKGHTVGKFDNWDACKTSITGYPNAEFKSFKTEAEADAYLCGDTANASLVSTPVSEDIANVFVSAGVKKTGNAVGVVVETSKGYVLDCGCVVEDNAILCDCISCLCGIQLAASMGFKRLNIYCNYEGLKKWATGEFKAKSDTANFYVCTLNKIIQSYGVVCRFFYNVPSRGMNIADKLVIRARTQHIALDEANVCNASYTYKLANIQNTKLFI